MAIIRPPALEPQAGIDLLQGQARDVSYIGRHQTIGSNAAQTSTSDHRAAGRLCIARLAQCPADSALVQDIVNRSDIELRSVSNTIIPRFCEMILKFGIQTLWTNKVQSQCRFLSNSYDFLMF